MSFLNSIVTRFALFFAVLLVSAITLAGFIAFQKAITNIVEDTNTLLKQESELIEQSIESLLNEIRNDIQVIAESPSLQKFSSNNLDTINTESLFRAILNNKQNYYQIRLIGVNNNGKELLRLDKYNSHIATKPFSDLQEKGDRPYFKSTVSLQSGEFYFSSIDLNQEYGVISKPYTPTIRAASPLFDEHQQLVGIVVINVSLTELFKSFQQILKENHQLFITDQTDQYIYHVDPIKRFAHQLNHNFLFSREYALEEDSLRMQLKMHKTNPQTYMLTSISNIPSYTADQRLRLILFTPMENLLKNAELIRLEILKIVVLIILAFLVIAFAYSTFFAKRIQRITNAISAYADGRNMEIPVAVKRNDELDTLLQSFLKMKATIDENLNELTKSLSETQTAKKERDQFLQNMSHELRTPLNTINGMTELLKKNNKNGPNEPIIDALERSAKNLSGLVYDILDHKKLVEGNIKLEPQATQMAQLVKGCASVYQYDAVSKKLSFHVEIDNSIEQKYYLIDALRFEQILSNLIVNAIKYTDKGEVLVALREEHESLELKVTDTGKGMQAEQVKQLNDLAVSNTQEIKEDLNKDSFGLGLKIVVDLVKLFGAKLQVVSAPDSGTAFTIRFPKVMPVKKPKPSFNAVLPLNFDSKMAVLHIEDDENNRLLVREFLNLPFISVTSKATVEAAQTALKTNSFDLIISDLNIETQNISDWLSETKSNYKIPTIVLSAQKGIKNSFQNAVDAELLKPFNGFDLQALTVSLWNQNEIKPPNFSAIYRDYDDNKEKITRVFKILIGEFKEYLNQITHVFESEDQKKWESIQHKLIAHVKRLHLVELEDIIEKAIEEIPTAKRERATACVAFYIACMRAEQLINLKD